MTWVGGSCKLLTLPPLPWDRLEEHRGWEVTESGEEARGVGSRNPDKTQLGELASTEEGCDW